MRFLANARNDRILCGIWESRGDSLSESPLLSPYTKISPCHSERQRGIPHNFFDILIYFQFNYYSFLILITYNNNYHETIY